jgi:hypothetical protein
VINLQKKPDVHDKDVDNIIFSYQVVVNSCATQTLLNTLTNLEIEKGELIQRFIDRTKNMDSFVSNLYNHTYLYSKHSLIYFIF